MYGKKFGNVFIGVQPTFGYEGDPMRLLFSKSASPHHGFAAYYTYIQKVFGADAVFTGTHGSLEFMPGKQVGMSDNCYPDLPDWRHPQHLLLRRQQPVRGDHCQAPLVRQHRLLPDPCGERGLYKGLKELKELISSYQGLKDSGRGPSIVNSIITTAITCNLDKDIPEIPTDDSDAKDFDMDKRDMIVGVPEAHGDRVSSPPCGLHVVGCPPSAEEAVATLVNIAGIDREDEGFLRSPRFSRSPSARTLRPSTVPTTRASSRRCSCSRTSPRRPAPW